MFNIQKAVSRLNYAPKLKEIKVTDIKQGLGVFTPVPGKAVSFAALKDTLKKAGYTLAAADIKLSGTLTREGRDACLLESLSGQRFVLVGAGLAKMLAQIESGSTVGISGDWKTVGSGKDSREVITPREVNKAATQSKIRSPASNFQVGSQATALGRKSAIRYFESPEVSGMMGEDASTSEQQDFFSNAFNLNSPRVTSLSATPLAPIRVTSPGLTVYRGGAVTPRLYFIRQHLGNLDVDRQVFDLSVSYTPSPRVQLELEIPVSRTAYNDNVASGSGVGLGNVTFWTKYRFFRKVKTYGDRQAAARLGLELPTGKKDAPTASRINVPAFVRQQLTPISGGFAPHFDIAFSQAGGRFIFGGNVEGILRTERDGFRMGHEIKVSSDLEYVLFPRKYVAPGGELFVIWETTFLHRGLGRLAGVPVSGSSATEYYVAPGLQYAMKPQFVIEGSFQFPVARNTGPLALRNDRNLLLGVRYLF